MHRRLWHMSPLLFIQRSIIGWNALNRKNNALLTVRFLNLINRGVQVYKQRFQAKKQRFHAKRCNSCTNISLLQNQISTIMTIEEWYNYSQKSLNPQTKTSTARIQPTVLKLYLIDIYIYFIVVWNAPIFLKWAYILVIQECTKLTGNYFESDLSNSDHN